MFLLYIIFSCSFSVFLFVFFFFLQGFSVGPMLRKFVMSLFIGDTLQSIYMKFTVTLCKTDVLLTSWEHWQIKCLINCLQSFLIGFLLFFFNDCFHGYLKAPLKPHVL